MPATQRITQIVDKVRRRLQEAESEGIYLKVVDHKFEDDWLWIAVVPSRPGVRASEHASFMSRVERGIRAEGDDNVLLVPVLED
jgi:hypothetical protein